MVWRPIALGTRSNPARHGQDGAARFVNCYLEEIGEDGKFATAVYAVDGLEEWGTVSGSGGVRALLPLDSELIAVVGRAVATIDPTGAATVVGGMPTDGLVQMARNRKAPDAQVGIVSDGIFSIYSGGAVTPVDDPDLPPPISIAGLDGYFVLLMNDGRFFLTSVDEGTEVDALDFASAEANPDGGIRAAVRNRDLCLFGAESLEIWNNTGGEDFPFSRTTSIDVGCRAANSVADVDQALCWVAHDGTVRLLDGYQALRVSTHAVERAIAGMSDPAAVQAFAWHDRGHAFYAIVGTGMSWVLDTTTRLWHERESVGAGRWRANAYASFAGQHIFGDYAAPSLYRMRNGLEDEAGDELVVTVQTPTQHGWPGRVKFNVLAVDAITGVGLNTTVPADLDPELMLSWSDDGGASFGEEQRISLGRQGGRLHRIRVFRLGAERGKGRIFRMSASAAVVRGLQGLSVDEEPLRA